MTKIAKFVEYLIVYNDFCESVKDFLNDPFSLNSSLITLIEMDLYRLKKLKIELNE